MADDYDTAGLVDEYLGVVGGGKPAAQRHATDDELQSILDSAAGARARAKATSAANDNPEAAAKALAISKKYNVPPSLVVADPEGTEARRKIDAAATAVENNQPLQRYIDEEPLAAQVSNDDYDGLNELTKRINSHKEGGLVQNIPKFFEIMGKPEGRQRLLDAIKNYPSEFVKGMIETAKIPGEVQAGKIDLNDPEGLDQAINLGTLIGLGRMNRMALTGRTSGGITIRFTGDKLTDRAQRMIDKGEIPPPGTDPLIDELHTGQNSLDAQTFDNIMTAAEATKTLPRSKDAIAAYVRKHDPGYLEISADTIANLYESKGSTPHEGDGLFGDVPDIKEQLANGLSSGVDVRISKADYAAYVDRTTHDAVKDSIRYRDKGFTKEEIDLAKEAEEEKPEGAPAEVPETPAPPKTPEGLSDEAKQLLRETTDAQESLYLNQDFRNAKALDVTKPTFKALSDKIENAHQELFDRVLKAAEQLTKKKQTTEWAKAEETTRREVEVDFNSRDDIAADKFIRTGELPTGEKRLGPFKLSTEAVEAELGKDHHLKGLVSDTGYDPDYVAHFVGYDSGAEMMRDLNEYNHGRSIQGIGPKTYLKRIVEKEVDSRMREKFGLLDQNIAEEAQRIALSEFQVDRLASEMRMLADQADIRPPYTREALEARVEANFGGQKMRQLRDWESLRRAIDQTGRKAFDAAMAGKFEEAYREKQRQILATLGTKETQAFAKEQRSIDRTFDRFSSQDTVKGVSQEYSNQIQGLLERIGWGTTREPGSLTASLKGVSLENFIQQKNTEGAMIPLADLPPVNSWREFTVDQYRDIGAMVKSLEHAGREAATITDGARKIAYEEGIGEAMVNLASMKKQGFDPQKRGPLSSLRRASRTIDAMLLKAEQVIDWIDKNDSNGPLNRMIYRALSEGELKKADVIAELARMAKEIPVDRAWGRRLQDLVDNRWLRDANGELVKVTRENMITAALNWGNKSNRDVLLRGKGWAEGDVENVLKNMTKMDWDFVKGVWGLFERLAPDIQAMTERRSGVPIKMVEPITVKTQFGDIKGGYFPLIEDPHSRLIGGPREHDLMGRHVFDPLPVAHALKTRTGKTYPLDLTLGTLHGRINETVHALYMQEAVANAYKVMKDPRIREGISGAFGPEYVAELDRWLRDVAQNGGMKDGQIEHYISSALRENVVMMLMGYKASTAAIHGLSAMASSVYEAGIPAFVRNTRALGLGQFLPNAARRMFSSPEKVYEAVDFVYKNSAEIRNRQHLMNRDFGAMMNKLTREGMADDLSAIRRANLAWSMSMVGYVDQLTTTMVWKSAYEKALTTMNEADAKYAADKSVRQAHGSTSLVSRANVGRGEVRRWLTIAYNGYWNHNYNRFRNASREMVDKNVEWTDRLVKGSAAVTALVVVPAIIHEMIRGQDHDNYAAALSEGIASQFAGQVPLVNSLLYAKFHHRDPQVSPFDTFLKNVTEPFEDFTKKAQGKQARHFVKHVAQFPGWLYGVGPSNQLADAGEFVKETLQRQQQPRSVMDWMRGLITGNYLPPHRRGRH